MKNYSPAAVFARPCRLLTDERDFRERTIEPDTRIRFRSDI